MLVPHFADGVLAHLLDLSTFEMKVIFSLTGSDTEIGGVRMIRNVIASEDVLHIAQEHPADKWRFENEHHKVRLTNICAICLRHILKKVDIVSEKTARRCSSSEKLLHA